MVLASRFHRINKFHWLKLDCFHLTPWILESLNPYLKTSNNDSWGKDLHGLPRIKNSKISGLRPEKNGLFFLQRSGQTFALSVFIRLPCSIHVSEEQSEFNRGVDPCPEKISVSVFSSEAGERKKDERRTSNVQHRTSNEKRNSEVRSQRRRRALTGLNVNET